MSLASRLAIFTAAWAFVLLACATAALYVTLVRNLNREDNEYLAGKLAILRSLARRPAHGYRRLRHEIVWGRDARPYSPIFVRVMAGRRILAVSRGMARLMPPNLFPAPVPFAASHVRPINVRGRDGLSYRATSVHVRAGRAGKSMVTIQAALDHAPERRILADYRAGLWGLLLAGLFVSTIGAYFICQWALRPIAQMRHAIERIESATLHHRLATDLWPAELAAMAAPFNSMLARLEDAFNRLAQFSADIAHELRTPVHTMRCNLDVAITKSRAPADYRAAIESALEECERLSAIIDNLLFLARAENGRRQAVPPFIDLSAEARALHGFYEPAAAESGVTLTVLAQRPVYAAVDRTMLQRALANLLDNALAHVNPGGRVSLEVDAATERARISVRDNGCGIAAEHLPHIFDRFHRVDASRSKNTGGVGLGLAIVQSIAVLHGGEAMIASDAEHGTCVTLYFPSAEKGSATDARGAEEGRKLAGSPRVVA